MREFLPRLVLALGILAAGADVAQAQGENGAASEDARAQALFEEGLTLTDRGRWPAAEARLRQSLELRPDDDRTRFHLARALAEQGEVTEATRHLRAIVHSGAPDPIIREAATELLVRTEPKTGRLVVELEGAVDDSTLLVDEVPVNPEDAEEGVTVDPGPHVISVTDAQGGHLARRRVDVQPGGAAHVSLDVAPTPEEAARASMAAEEDRPRLLHGDDDSITSTWWFWTGVGVVIVGAVVTTLILMADSSSPTDGDAPPVHVRGNERGLAVGR